MTTPGEDQEQIATATRNLQTWIAAASPDCADRSANRQRQKAMGKSDGQRPKQTDSERRPLEDQKHDLQRNCAGDGRAMGRAMSTKANPPPTHHRKPTKGHPWKAFAACARTENRRDADAKPSTTKRKVPK